MSYGARGPRPEDRLLLGLEVLAREALRATVSTTAVLVAAPACGMGAGILERRHELAGEAVVADRGHGALDAPFVAGMAHARWIDVKAARLGVFEKGRRDPRGQRSGGRDDGAGVIRNQNLEDATEEGPCRLARLNRTRGRLLECRIDKPIARADGGEDPRAKSPFLSGERQPADPSGVDLQ